MTVSRVENRARRAVSRSVGSSLQELESRSLFAATGAIYGQYYDNSDFTALSFTRNDPGIHFDWQNRAPLTRMSAQTFSARWVGQIRSQSAGTYSFVVDTDGAATLKVRGQTLTLTPVAGGTTSTATINLPANQVVDLQLDYVHNTGNAHVDLDWTTPDSASVAPIPTNLLVNSFSPPASSFNNPIVNAGADPWVIQWHDEYIYVWSDGGRIYGSRSPRLQDIGSAPAVVLYSAPSSGDHSRDVWAPELHRLDDKWYLYFAADDGNNANHRMFVATRNADDPLATFTYSSRLTPATDRWAIDGTVMDYGGLRYFVWSGWEGNTDGQQNLYIARMSSPTAISGDRVLISTPTAAWETHGLPINEGPEIVQRAGETHVIFSGSGYWTNDYALGDLKLTGSNAMNPTSWTKTAGPIFSQGNGVAGVGHASFVTSPDGTQDWIVYHAHKDPNVFNDDRVIRAQPFTFNGGTPVFGPPIANSTTLTEPSGTPTLYNASGGISSTRSGKSVGSTLIAALLGDIAVKSKSKDLGVGTAQLLSAILR